LPIEHEAHMPAARFQVTPSWFHWLEPHSRPSGEAGDRSIALAVD
jgi:hypothetical protein